MALTVLKKTTSAPLSQAWLDSYVERHFLIKELLDYETQDRTLLIERGPQRYECSNNHDINVIFPAPRIGEPDQEEVPEIEKAIGKKNVNVLFEKVTRYKPVKSVLQVAQAILTAPMLRKFLVLTQRESPAQVRVT